MIFYRCLGLKVELMMILFWVQETSLQLFLGKAIAGCKIRFLIILGTNLPQNVAKGQMTKACEASGQVILFQTKPWIFMHEM